MKYENSNKNTNFCDAKDAPGVMFNSLLLNKAAFIWLKNTVNAVICEILLQKYLK